jgi:hypothetical protein
MFLKKCGKTAPNSLIHNEQTWTKGQKMAGKCRSRENQMMQLLADPSKAANFARIVFDLLVQGQAGNR